MTWAEMKHITLQKIDEATGEDNSEYVSQMAPPANEALPLLAGAGKEVIRSYEIVQTGEETGRQRYDMKELTPDWVELQSVYFDNGATYGQSSNYSLEGSSVIVLEPAKGTWRVYYQAYPYEINGSTPEDEPLSIDPEVAVIIPLYIASQIYKHDNVSLATIWRNEFEIAREALLMKYQQNKVMGQAGFVSLKGVW